MNITATKIKIELENKYGWVNINERGAQSVIITKVVTDTLKIVDEILKRHKNISIK